MSEDFELIWEGLKAASPSHVEHEGIVVCALVSLSLPWTQQELILWAEAPQTQMLTQPSENDPALLEPIHYTHGPSPFIQLNKG